MKQGWKFCVKTLVREPSRMRSGNKFNKMSFHMWVHRRELLYLIRRLFEVHYIDDYMCFFQSFSQMLPLLLNIMKCKLTSNQWSFQAKRLMLWREDTSNDWLLCLCIISLCFGKQLYLFSVENLPRLAILSACVLMLTPLTIPYAEPITYFLLELEMVLHLDLNISSSLSSPPKLLILQPIKLRRRSQRQSIQLILWKKLLGWYAILFLSMKKRCFSFLSYFIKWHFQWSFSP